MESLENILIVDDESANLRLLTKMLNDKGYRVRAASSGMHALTTTQREVPDLILLDVMMPEMSGYEVCRILKTEEHTRDVPVIFLSALSEAEDKIKSFEAGGVDYITKPFSEKEVLLRVETHLKIHRLQQKLHSETERFKILAAASFDGILIHVNGRIIDMNSEASSLLGYKESELKDKEISEIIPREHLDKILSNRISKFEGNIISMNGSLIPVEIRTKDFLSNGQQVIAIRDLSFQKEAERQKQELLNENKALRTSMQERYRFGDIIGRSQKMQKIYELISKAAASEFPAVIYGESGTGKELAAKTIHRLSDRKNRPFIAVNCGAITESIFEREFFGHRKGAFTGAVKDEPGFIDAAQKGTLFLDELGELSIAMQVKLLRVLESGEYTPVGDISVKKANIRILVATNKNLQELIDLGKFREDLFYRINVIQIDMPPLRERREDIILLVEHILSSHQATDKIADLPVKLREMFYYYDWPGNVRELINTIQRYLATDSVSISGTGKEVRNETIVTPGINAAIESLERQMILDALEKTNWRRIKAAELLKMPRRSLHRKMVKYQINSSGK